MKHSESSKARILVVDDDQSIRWVLVEALTDEGFTVDAVANAKDARLAIEKKHYQAVLSDIRMPGEDGLSFLKAIQETQQKLPVIIMTAHSDLQSAVNAYEYGAFDYLPKPFDVDNAIELVKRASAQSKKSELEQNAANDADSAPMIIGEAPAMQEVFRAVGRLSRSNVSVLINGESGTGKELVARALHLHSKRSEGPFIALNMAAIPSDLIESELFGHEKGAFTGANQRYKGRFEQAENGTLFLDEIGDMPLETQTRLLRVLSEGSFYRVGGNQPVQANVRVIAATHQNLSELVSSGKFREDLFHRINVIKIHLPNLKDRISDLPLLIDKFLSDAASELDSEVKKITDEALNQLMSYHWPGNVRELENMCRWLMVMSSGSQIDVKDLPPELIDTEQSNSTPASHLPWQQYLERYLTQKIADGDQNIFKHAQDEFEEAIIRCALAQTAGHKQDAAALLGWGRNTITRKLKKFDSK